MAPLAAECFWIKFSFSVDHFSKEKYQRNASM